MAKIAAQQVKLLREKTGLGMMECKKALVESDGDIDVAIDNLRKSSAMKAAKKAERISAEGIAHFCLSDDAKKGYLVEINSETDFVARDDSFIEFVNQVLEVAVVEDIASIDSLLQHPGISSKRDYLVQKLGENIQIRRLQKVVGDLVGGYTHNNSKIAVLVAMSSSDKIVAKDVAMHIAAFNPLVVSGEDISQDLIDKEREIYTAQAQGSGKSIEIITKIVEGKIKKYLSENSLLDQNFVKDDKIKVAKYIGKGKVLSFCRYFVGEGIEKKSVDFAREVAEQLK